jgi:pyrroline-5-carboxylate reductase
MPLTERIIATIGSGVMAEAMIAGLLRGGQVTPDRIVASHPRADRREVLERALTVAGFADGDVTVTSRFFLLGRARLPSILP